ncbi:MAG: TonB-dependent receptor, partial [Bryobacteraceae bacterium]
FGGTFTFSGGQAPVLDANNQPVLGETAQISSLESYRRTLLFQQLGYPMAQIRLLGSGPSQFSISGGNPTAAVNQTDIGLFIGDDWRARKNLTLSYGLRYETQTNIHDWRDWAPRFGLAWAPSSRKSARSLTVIRAGFGIFYDRFSEGLVLESLRFNGVLQQQFLVPDPSFYPNIPSAATLEGQRVPSTIHTLDSGLRAPYVMQSAVGIERQLPFHTTVAVNYTNSHGLHELLSRNINAALPGAAVLPFGDAGSIYQYESAGLYNQNQVIFNVNSRINSKISVFGGYVLNRANSNTDGPGTFPANQYNLAGEYGRSSLDRQNRLFMSGSFITRWNVRLSPFIIANSGSPFNITTGRYDTGDSLYTDRPAFATDLTKPGVVVTRFGAFDTLPTAGETIIPRNYGNGPAYVSINMRVSKTFGFGPSRESAAMNPALAGGDSHQRSGFGGGGYGGSRGGGGGGGHERHGGGGGGGGDATTNKRFNLIVSVQARNLFNHDNLGPYIGNLTSPLFGQANSLAGGFRDSSANNRRLELSLRLSF